MGEREENGSNPSFWRHVCLMGKINVNMMFKMNVKF